MKTLYDYYKTQTLLPTFAALADDEALGRYTQTREAIFRDRLGLPIRLFRGMRILEFGPDSGENALVFARWGARMVLAEPNAKAHPRIQEYFDRFGALDSLERITAADVLAFKDESTFDFIVAEGFIYTVQPTQAWLEAFRRLLGEDGLFFVNYMERAGSCIELCWKALHAAYGRAAGADAIQAARDLFTVKWNSIPHTRTFDSWTMDVLQNPFVRAKYFIDAHEFIDAVDAAGFELQATFPSYDDGARIEWHKTPVSREERKARLHSNTRACALGLLAGTKLVRIDSGSAPSDEGEIRGLVADIDRLIEEHDHPAFLRVETAFARFAARVQAGDFFAQDETGALEVAAMLESLSRAFRAAGQGDANGLVRLMETDGPLIRAWGTPTHLAVGRRARD